MAKATVKEINQAVANTEKAAVALGRQLAAVQTSATALNGARQQYETASAQCTKDGPGSDACVDRQSDFLKEGTAVRAFNGAAGQAGNDAEALAEAPSALSPPAARGQVLMWRGVALGVAGVVTGGLSDVVGAMGDAAAAETLGEVSTATGAGSAAVDTVQCAKGSDAACLSAGLGVVAAGGSYFGAVGAGRVARGEVEAYNAYAIAAQASGFFGESSAIASLVIDSELAALGKR